MERMEKQLTAVEWLAKQFDTDEFRYGDRTKIIQQAKEMDMSQLEKFYNHGMWALVDGNGHGDSFIDYYNKTFKSE